MLLTQYLTRCHTRSALEQRMLGIFARAIYGVAEPIYPKFPHVAHLSFVKFVSLKQDDAFYYHSVGRAGGHCFCCCAGLATVYVLISRLLFSFGVLTQV
jgi:hypothetical protein